MSELIEITSIVGALLCVVAILSTYTKNPDLLLVQRMFETGSLFLLVKAIYIVSTPFIILNGFIIIHAIGILIKNRIIKQ